MKQLARERLKDARALYRARRYDGAVYLCGYAVEIALKARIAQTLKWTGFPETRAEFQGKESIRSHSFDALLAFTAHEVRIRTSFGAEWSIVGNWSPDVRYQPPGSTAAVDAHAMIDAAAALVRTL